MFDRSKAKQDVLKARLEKALSRRLSLENCYKDIVRKTWAYVIYVQKYERK